MNRFPARVPLAAWVALVLAAMQVAWGATTEVLVDDANGDFRGGEYTTSTLTWDGHVSAPALRKRATDLDAEVVWDAVRDKAGRVHVATGHAGRLFSIEGSRATLRHKFDEPALYALAAMDDGAILVGASPTGIVYRVPPAGEPTILSRTGQSLIWKLVPRRDGSVLAATGPEARVLLIDAKGTTTTLARIPDATNVLDLVDQGERGVVAATQGKGLVVRIEPGGRVFVLADSEQEEVRRLAVRPDGTILAAVNGQRSPGDRFFKRVPQAPPNEKRENKPRDVAFVFSIFPDGYADELWPSPEVPIHDIALLDDGRLLVGAGSKGALYAIDERGRTDQLGGSESKVLSRIAPDGEGRWLLGTGDAASIETLEPARTMKGEFASRVFNMKGSARWGNMQVVAERGDFAGLKVSTRSGNTSRADKGWSDWTAPTELAAGVAPIVSPTSRFIQYKLHFEDGSAARVDAVRLFYRQVNVRPNIISFELKPVEPPKDGAKRSPPGVVSRTGPVFVDPDSNTRAFDISWKAEDANGDALLYELFHQMAGSDRWVPVGEEQSATTARLDTRGMPDGLYRFRLVASDRSMNPRGDEKEGEAVSGLYVIDNTIPEVVRFDLRKEAPGIGVSARAEDSASNIVAAAWRIDSGDWNFLLPVDGMFDGRAEAFDFVVGASDAKPGAVLSFLVTDDGGNTAVRSATLE